MTTACLALDIGGTKLAAGIVSEKGELIVSEEVATPKTISGDPRDSDRLLACLVDLAKSTLSNLSTRSEVIEVVGCGVGCGGPMSEHGYLVSPLNIPGWRKFPLLERLATSLSLEVWVDNDAKALALGEWWVGSAQGLNNFIAIVVSTGVGGGVFSDGKILDGDSGNAGHIGHMIVEPDGRECECGARGCLEAEVSGTAIAKTTGAPASFADLATKERAGKLVGRAVASISNLLDLRTALVAGSVALGFGDAFFQAAQCELDRCARLEFSRGAKILPCGLGSTGPLIGAGAVGFRGLELFGKCL